MNVLEIFVQAKELIISNEDGTLQAVGTRLIVYPRREDALKAVEIVLTTV